MPFEFSMARRVIFGAGAITSAGDAARDLGRRALVVTGRSTDRARPLLRGLADRGVAVTTVQIHGEPDVAAVERGRDLCRAEACDVVIGFGGGSAIDAAKAVAALAANAGAPLDYLEVVGRGLPLERPALPCIAIPTTAGTGSETTRNAVIGAAVGDERAVASGSRERSGNHGVPASGRAGRARHVKVSLRHASLLPRVAIVDPDLTLELPPALTATTGLDAMTQLIEAYVSIRATPMTDAGCIAGMSRGAAALPAAFRNGQDRQARHDMALASFWSGVALANAGLGAVHGFAGPIGGAFPAPHGAVCAALLPHAIEVNLSALRSREPDSPAIARYEQVARLLTGKPTAAAGDAARWAAQMAADLEIPTLSRYGVTREDVETLVDHAARASSMKANPIVLTRDELCELLERAL